MSTPLFGRKKLLDELEDSLWHGKTLLLLGPLGIGKSRILEELAVRLQNRGRPCGFAHHTRSLGDVTAALWSAYPDSDDTWKTQRQLRSRLGLAVEERPGALLLDHVTKAGTATRGYLRSLRGTGLGVALAADVENDRDNAAARALNLTHVEITVPPLPGTAMAKILDVCLSRKSTPYFLEPGDRRRVLRLAKGNPGRLLMLADLLTDDRYWRSGRVLTNSLNAAALDLVLDHYLTTEITS